MRTWTSVLKEFKHYSARHRTHAPARMNTNNTILNLKPRINDKIDVKMVHRNVRTGSIMQSNTNRPE